MEERTTSELYTREFWFAGEKNLAALCRLLRALTWKPSKTSRASRNSELALPMACA